MSSSIESNIKIVFAGAYNENEILTGPEKVSKRIFTEYAKTGNTVFFDYFRDGSKYGIFEKLFGYENITVINQSPVLRLGIFRMLISLFKLNPQIIHILSYERFTVCIFILKLFIRCKIYYTVNAIIRHENKYYNKESIFSVFKNIIAESVIMNLSDNLFYLSKRSKDYILYYYRINKTKLKPARNGLDDCFINSPDKYSEKIINSIVFIGDLNQKAKGSALLFNSLSKIETKIKLYIISEHPIINSPNINESLEIVVMNKTNPLYLIEFYRTKNIVISTSEYDTFNISVLEAVSCGLYPILTEETGISEIISEFTNCSIFKFGDSGALSRIISSLIYNKLAIQPKPNLRLLSWENVIRKYYLPYYNNKQIND